MGSARFFIVSCFFLGCSIGTFGGCFRGPKPVKPPLWEPEKFADKCLEQLDTNQDGAIDTKELESAPGLKAGVRQIDANADTRLDRPELVARFRLYEEMQVGLRTEYMEVYYKNQPLENAKVRLIPEEFLQEVIEPAEGITDVSGGAVPTNGLDSDPGVRVGYYRVEITSDQVNLPPKYNASTTLGVEIAPVSASSGYTRLRFQLK